MTSKDETPPPSVPVDEVVEWMESVRQRDKSADRIAELVGSSLEELAWLYGKRGRRTAADLARRAEVDAGFKRLVESRRFTQVEIGRALGWPILNRWGSGHECRKLAAALRRARRASN